MQTRLGLFCDRAIEAGLVAAVVMVPLLFNVYGQMAFDLNKTALLRSIILILAVAWLVRTAEMGLRPDTKSGAESKTSTLRRFLGTPVALPILILAAAYVLSTIFSIWPRGSLWGSYLRSQGTYANLAYMAIFPLALTALRRREQVDRLVTAVLLTSFPVALYGIMQHYRVDPFRWVGLSDLVPDRVISTLGNPVFLAAYLLMMIPLTLGRIAGSVTATRQGRVTPVLGYFLVACYSVLLAVQLLASLFTQTRGALVGLGVGCLLLALLLATIGRRRAQILAFTLLSIEVLLFFVILNLPNTPLEPLRRLPYLGRLGQVFNLQSGSGRLRVLIWGGVLDLTTSDPLRALVGYGPETLDAAVGPYLPTELVKMGVARGGKTADRSHNETLDALATTGLIGTAAYFLVLTAVFYHGLKALGLIESIRQRYTFIGSWLAGGVLVPLAFRAFEGTWRLTGVGVPIGMLVGLFVYMLGYSFLAPRHGSLVSIYQQIMISSLLAAVAAHFVEIQFGIAVTTTRVFFWLYVALIVIVGYSAMPSVASAPQAPRPQRRRRRRQQLDPSSGGEETVVVPTTAGPGRVAFVYYSLVMGLALLTLGFDFSAPGAGTVGIGANMLLFFVVVCVFGGMIIHGETQALGGEEVGGDWSPLVYLGTALIFALLLAAGLRPFATTLARGLGGLITYHLWLLVIIAVLAAWLLLAPGRVSAPFSRRPWWLYAPVLAIALVLITVTNVTPVRADMIYARALALTDTDERIAFLQRSVDMAPNETPYTSLGKAYLDKARASATASEASAWLEEARAAFEQAWALDPVLPERTANLGRLYREWGELSLRSEDRIERLNTAIEHYTRAGEMSPLQAALSAEELSETYLLLGIAQEVAGQSEQAAAAYEMAFGTAPESAWAFLAKGASLAQQGRLEEAAEAIGQAIILAPDSYVAHWTLARVHQRLGRSETAGDEADKARKLVPQSLRVHLETLLGRLGGDT